MTETRFWMVRHALVEENARAVLYGTLDVELCPATLKTEQPTFRDLARRLPRPASWIVTPLSRTRRTADAIFAAGYPEQPLAVEPSLIEQDLGEWQGMAHASIVDKLTMPGHPFWPLNGQETPPGGESFAELLGRVAAGMERLATDYAGQDVVIVAHGGSIRAAVAHALGIGADNALHLSVYNLALTRIERTHGAWRVIAVNELAGI